MSGMIYGVAAGSLARAFQDYEAQGCRDEECTFKIVDEFSEPKRRKGMFGISKQDLADEIDVHDNQIEKLQKDVTRYQEKLTELCRENKQLLEAQARLTAKFNSVCELLKFNDGEERELTRLFNPFADHKKPEPSIEVLGHKITATNIKAETKVVTNKVKTKKKGK